MKSFVSSELLAHLYSSRDQVRTAFKHLAVVAVHRNVFAYLFKLSGGVLVWLFVWGEVCRFALEYVYKVCY